ncbi:hypothetical protein [Rhodobacter maris]|uniref:DUF1444 family protein n=1 Tax=Rhodobacter maris TaxID=446682 RepID=A0A285S5E0_9RHOB|nr:hypothetical protein [Rhodobacter maris]SOC02120.1 hypothetical protein SAMN05877831_10384 [Rhodobacter maris]
MRRGGLALALMLAAGPAAADIARPQSLDALLVVLQNAVAATGDATEIRPDPSAHRLFLTWKGTQLVADPHNLFMAMQGAMTDAERQEMLDAYLAAFDDLVALEGGVLDPARLLPILRPSTFAEHLPEARKIAAVPWAAGLSIYLVEDRASSTAYVTPERLKGAGLDGASATKAALANLATHKTRFEPLGTQRWALVLDGTYESSLLLDNELWRRFAEDQGPPIMVVPNRDTVVVDTSGTPEAAADLAAFARAMQQANPYPVSDQVFRWTGQAWAVLSPP